MPAEIPPSGSASAASQDSPEEKLVRLLTRALHGMVIQLDGEAVGRLVAPTVDAELGMAAFASRYQP